MSSRFLLLSLLSCAALAAAADTTATPDAAPESNLRPGSWGIGLRPFGTTTSLLAYRAFAPRWDGLLKISWNGSRADQQTPSTQSSTSTNSVYPDSTQSHSTLTTTSGSGTSVTNARTVSAVLQAEYDLPTGHGIDFKAGFGPSFAWTWNDADQSSDLIAQTGANLSPSTYTNTWTASGGVRGTLGVRWWFVPQRLALAGEFEAGAAVGYTSSQTSNSTANSTSYSGTAKNATYTTMSQNSSSSSSSAWNYSTSTYTCSLGLDAFF